MHNAQRGLAEVFGTFWLVFGGCGAAVLAAGVPTVGIGYAGVALAFGLTVLTMAYTIGHVSGCHLNPAVTIGLVVGKRFPAKEIVPYVIAQVIVYASLLIPLSIVGEATLSFLSIGVQPPTADWGAMIASAQQGGIYQVAWWFLVFPGLALLITTLAFNILGDGIRDAFDPRADRLFV